MTCGCNDITILFDGGILIAGTADVSGGRIVYDETASGGVVCNSSARVEITGDTWDGFEAVWPLDAQYDSTPDEVEDVTRNQLHGVAGNAGNQCPDLITGVYCLGAQDFVGDDLDFISIPADGITSDQEFAVSLWYRPNELYSPRAIFTRGQRTDGNEWIFNLSTSFINHVVANVHLADETTADCYSSTTMDVGYWYHIGCNWEGGALTLYIDGSEDGTATADDSSLLELGNGGHMGRWNEGGFPTAYLQEVRLHPVPRSESYFLAEHDNFCNPLFISYGSEESLIDSVIPA